MLVEAKQAFYNEETGAVTPWRDIEVTEDLGNELVSEGLVAAIAAGGGGGGDYPVYNVTLIAGEGDPVYCYAWTNDDSTFNDIFLCSTGFGQSSMVNSGETLSIKLMCFGDTGGLSCSGTIDSIAGDAVYDSDTGMIAVSGDCTITAHRE